MRALRFAVYFTKLEPAASTSFGQRYLDLPVPAYGKKATYHRFHEVPRGSFLINEASGRPESFGRILKPRADVATLIRRNFRDVPLQLRTLIYVPLEGSNEFRAGHSPRFDKLLFRAVPKIRPRLSIQCTLRFLDVASARFSTSTRVEVAEFCKKHYREMNDHVVADLHEISIYERRRSVHSCFSA